MRHLILSLTLLTVAPPLIAQEAPPPAVVVAPAAMVELAETATFNGRLAADRRVAIVARVSGTLLEQDFEPGDVVEEGHVLFRIEPDLYEAAVREAEGSLKSAEANLALAQIERDRQAELVAREAVAQTVLDNAEAQLLGAEGDVLRLEASLASAQLNLSYTEITAPFTGRLGIPSVDVGALVGIDSGSLVMLTKLDPIYAEFPVPTAVFRNYQERVATGEATQSAAATLALANGTGYPEPGDIDFVDSAVTTGTDSIQIRARFPNPEGQLLAEELVRVTLTSASQDPVLAIPQQAVQRDLQGAFALVVDGQGVANRRAVEIARITEGMAVIATGLEEGELVITEGVNKVRPGSTVNAAEAGDG